MGAGLALFIGRGQITRGADWRRNLFLVPMSIVRPQPLEGALHLMEGRRVQHEVLVAGLAVAALAVPVFNLDEFRRASAWSALRL